MVSDQDLIAKARSVNNPRQLSPLVSAGSVSCALLSDTGNVYTGVNINTCCSMGFCAEHTAIGAMITQGESKVATIVAVNRESNIISPCGRCREFIYQINDDNGATRVLLKSGAVQLATLLPEYWMSEATFEKVAS